MHCGSVSVQRHFIAQSIACLVFELQQEEIRISCPLSEMQTFWYRRLLMRDSTMLKEAEKDVQVGYQATTLSTHIVGLHSTFLAQTRLQSETHKLPDHQGNMNSND